MFSLYWWNYVVMGGIVFLSAVAAGWVIGRIEDRRTERPGRHPCMEHVGTEVTGALQYCGQLCGHDSPHGDEILVTFPQPVLTPAK